MNENLIECVGLCKTYTTDAENLAILKELDFSVERGASVAVTGASGSGKSTLLSILGGLDRATSGKVRVGEWRLDSLPEKKLTEYRSLVTGFVFQFHYLLKDLSARENVAMPALMAGKSRREAMERATAILESLGLSGRCDHYPSQLSGGERQRAAIARAIVNQPALVLADEPTGNLDKASAEGVRDILFGLPASCGATLVLVTHDPGLAATAGKQYLLENGRLSLR